MSQVVNLKPLSKEVVQEAAEILKKGGLVITPTRTNYNVICDPMNPDAIAKVFAVKRRTKFGPLTLYIPDPKETSRYVIFPENFRESILESVWPGELSIIFYKRYPFPDQLTMGSPTIAVTCQGESGIQSIAEQFGPVAMTSANLSGQGDIFVDLVKAVEDIGSEVDLVIDAGQKSPAEESGSENKSNTIIDLTFGPPYLVRKGVFPLEKVRQLFPGLIEDTEQYKEVLNRRLLQAKGEK